MANSGIVTWLLAAISFLSALCPLIILLYAIVNRSRCPRAAARVILGSGLILVACTGSIVLSFFGGRLISLQWFMVCTHGVSAALYLVGMVILASAAFVDRTPAQPQPYQEFENRSSSDSENPFRAPVQ